VLAALGRGLKDEFPNPERVGCPGREVIAAIAARRMPLSEAQTYLDHLGACSPCYHDFLGCQAKYRQRRTRMIFAVAASVLIVVGLATWAILRPHNQQIASAVVDLRDRSMARGTGSPPPDQPAVEIPRYASHLEIYLPLGSVEGAYDVRISSGLDQPLSSGTGNARLQQGATVLTVDLEPHLSKAGTYLLQIRRPQSEWSSFPVRVR
jgi:hypothetical protein